MKEVEVRAFGELMKLFPERNWPWPLLVDVEEQTTADDLARKLDIPMEKVEIIFINGFAQKLDHPIKPGDRIAFVPPGTPGPYRLILGFAQSNKEKVELGRQSSK
jgi:molybdopterin converting factor small subunit